MNIDIQFFSQLLYTLRADNIFTIRWQLGLDAEIDIFGFTSFVRTGICQGEDFLNASDDF